MCRVCPRPHGYVQNVLVCTFKTSPCVPSKRPHADVLNVPTEASSRQTPLLFPHTTHRQHTTPHNTLHTRQQHDNNTTTTHTHAPSTHTHTNKKRERPLSTNWFLAVGECGHEGGGGKEGGRREGAQKKTYRGNRFSGRGVTPLVP